MLVQPVQHEAARAQRPMSGRQAIVPRPVNTRSCRPASSGSAADASGTSDIAKRTPAAPTSAASARGGDGGGADIHAKHPCGTALRERDAVIAQVALQVDDGQPRGIADLRLDDRIEPAPPRAVRRDIMRRGAEMDRRAFLPVGEVPRAPIRARHRGTVSSTQASAASRTPRARAAAIAARRSRR